jgi:hypothetical protein
LNDIMIYNKLFLWGKSKEIIFLASNFKFMCILNFVFIVWNSSQCCGHIFLTGKNNKFLKNIFCPLYSVLSCFLIYCIMNNWQNKCSLAESLRISSHYVPSMLITGLGYKFNSPVPPPLCWPGPWFWADPQDFIAKQRRLTDISWCGVQKLPN